jgi:tartrate dehydrogenase/decarboxylase / D-malate dehydrogenase
LEGGRQVTSPLLGRPLDQANVSGHNVLYDIDTLIEMKTYKIAAIPGDGIGKEVIVAGLEVPNACAASDGGVSLESQTFDWSTDYYKKHGVLTPENGREQLRNFDAIYFGAVGAPDVPDHITLWVLRLAICQPFDQYANVRPTRIFPALKVPCGESRPKSSIG